MSNEKKNEVRCGGCGRRIDELAEACDDCGFPRGDLMVDRGWVPPISAPNYGVRKAEVEGDVDELAVRIARGEADAEYEADVRAREDAIDEAFENEELREDYQNVVFLIETTTVEDDVELDRKDVEDALETARLWEGSGASNDAERKEAGETIELLELYCSKRGWELEEKKIRSYVAEESDEFDRIAAEIREEAKADAEKFDARLPDLDVDDAVLTTDRNGRIREIEVRGITLDGKRAWILLHVDTDTVAGLRFVSDLEEVVR